MKLNNRNDAIVMLKQYDLKDDFGFTKVEEKAAIIDLLERVIAQILELTTNFEEHQKAIGEYTKLLDTWEKLP